MQDPTNSFKNVPTWILVDLLSSQHFNLTTQVDQVCFYCAGALAAPASTNVEIVARSSANASPSSAALMVTTPAGTGRINVLADSDLSVMTPLLISTIGNFGSTLRPGPL